MKIRRRFSRPLLTLVAIQLVWAVVVFYWIYWFLGRSREFRALAEKYKPDLLPRDSEWLVLTQGIVLLLLILAGVYIIFLYWRWQLKLYRHQQSSIAQVTHELKSPLASIRLHLETMRLRRLPPERLDAFLDTMLADTDRLQNLINNLLLTAKLDRRRQSVKPPIIDFSAFLRRFIDQCREKLPPEGTISADVDDGIEAAVNVEEMEMVLRNLFENSLLYSIEAPEIHVSLKGGRRRCVLTFGDRGKGLEKDDLNRVFQMFYRVRGSGESIRGTGLGLYIVKTVIEDHGGKVTAESAGPGAGCTFVITLPRESREVAE
jgi:signal transduction histidine kinase